MDAVVVVTVGLPRMLRDILGEAIRNHSNIDLIANIDSVKELQRMELEQHPDYIVIENKRADYGQLLRQFSSTKFVSIEGHGKRVFFWELVPQKTAIGEVSPDRLVEYMAGPGVGHVR